MNSQYALPVRTRSTGQHISFISRPIARARAIKKAPFPDVPSAYVAYLCLLGGSTLRNHTVPLTISPSYAPAEFGLFAFKGSDTIMITPRFREKTPESRAVVDNFEIVSGRYGIFHLTHFRSGETPSRTTCTIRRDILSWTAFHPRLRRSSMSFDTVGGKIYTDWIWEEVNIQPRRFGPREDMMLARPTLPDPLDNRLFWGKRSKMSKDLEEYQV
jgi:hypothetical protein